MSVSRDKLIELLDYDPETGVFRKKKQQNTLVSVGQVVGCIDKTNGYSVVYVGSRQYRAHRLAWLYVHGTWPIGDIDHINGNRSDNRIANLRSVSRTVNMQNMRNAPKRSISKLLGAATYGDRWVARIKVNGIIKNIGVFDTAMEAHCAYINAKRVLHPGCTI